eukprot:1346777-Amphidinium_carterae.2
MAMAYSSAASHSDSAIRALAERGPLQRSVRYVLAHLCAVAWKSVPVAVTELLKEWSRGFNQSRLNEEANQRLRMVERDRFEPVGCMCMAAPQFVQPQMFPPLQLVKHGSESSIATPVESTYSRRPRVRLPLFSASVSFTGKANYMASQLQTLMPCTARPPLAMWSVWQKQRVCSTWRKRIAGIVT